MTPPRQFLPFTGLLFVFLLALSPGKAQDDKSGLRVLIVEGEGALNNVKLRTLKPVVVEVQADGKPAPGASVTFILPNQGPSGTFLNDSTTITVNADVQGRASSSAIHPNGATGAMPVRVTVSYQGMTANATVHQTNVTGVSSSSTGLSTGAKAVIVLAAGGIYAGTGGSSNSSNSTPPPAIVITPGTPVVGGPK